MQEEIARVYKLDDGYVLCLYGRNIVARDVKELGQKLSRLANRRPKAPTVAEKPIPVQNPPENVVPIRPEPTWDEQRALDDRNLSRLISARVSNQISEEDLMRGAEKVVKTYSLEEVAKLVFVAEQQFFNAQEAIRGQGLGTQCSCPGCTQNQSYPNERGWCVSCYQGEHLHPGGQDGHINDRSRRTVPQQREDPGTATGADIWESDDTLSDAGDGDAARGGDGRIRGDDERDAGEPVLSELPTYERDASTDTPA